MLSSSYRRFFSRTALVSGLSLGLLATCSSAFAQQYQVENRWNIGGEGGWDYLIADPGAHLLYVTHGPRVEVIDTTTGKPAGALTGFKSTHGVALDDKGQYGYVSDGAGNAVDAFDRHTFKVVATIPAGTNPDGIVYEPVTKTVWAFNGRSQDASVIDTATQKVVATIKLSGKPEFPTVDGKGNVFVNIETKNSIVKLDAKSKTVTAEWPLTGCESPSGMAIDTDHHRLFSVCDGKKMAVTDYTSGKVIATPEIGDSPDAAGYDAKHQLAFSSNGDGTLTVVDTSSPVYKVLQNVATQKSARTMAFDSGTGRIYLVAAEFGPKPAATAENPRPRAQVIPGSFTILVVGRK
ncbi:YVTN family beta-propeller protein [Edaphobacter aggregans]|uniref:YVTN family beta-propeller protein n=1 Tax=Edaphobacter aggregans TaxID=570835 RepID=A0A3R9PPP6_9BACT|nr:YncE family protein [Edaphobacter aggregans]RSL15098.1 YVTN family beta-propeller protein [Edaphobacter aggregans]